MEGAASLTQVFEGLLIYLLVACNFLSSVVLYGHLCTKGYLLSLDYFPITLISLPVAQLFQEFLLCGNKMPTRCNRGFYCNLIACSTCFWHHYAHHQELKSIITQWLLRVVFCAVKM